MSTGSVVIDDLLAAQKRIEGYTVKTPLLESPVLNERLNGRLLVKAEVLQRTGSFKDRGAFNFLSALDPEIRAHGVVAYSSGNHAQAVAAAANYYGIPAAIVMPADAPTVKIRKTRAFGAEVILYDRINDSREAIGRDIAETHGYTLVPPYDHPVVIAGQGTVGLEMLQHAEERNASFDHLLIPCSGGGLAAGCGIAFQSRSIQTKLYAVEPEGYADTALSLQSRERVAIQPGQSTLCDALMMPQPGEITFPLNQNSLTGAFVVSDTEVIAAMIEAFEQFHLVVEPGGAVALAFVLSHPEAFRQQTTGIILSGGNIDRKRYSELIAGSAA